MSIGPVVTTCLSRIVHQKDKLKCTFCDHTDSQKWRMLQHVRVTHLGERLFPCHLCDFSAEGKRRLESHLKSAHGVTASTAAGSGAHHQQQHAQQAVEMKANNQVMPKQEWPQQHQ